MMHDCGHCDSAMVRDDERQPDAPSRPQSGGIACGCRLQRMKEADLDGADHTHARVWTVDPLQTVGILWAQWCQGMVHIASRACDAAPKPCTFNPC